MRQIILICFFMASAAFAENDIPDGIAVGPVSSPLPAAAGEHMLVSYLQHLCDAAQATKPGGEAPDSIALTYGRVTVTYDCGGH